MARAWQVRELSEPEAIRPYLEHDRLYAAYALGDLEPGLFSLCRWWLAERCEGRAGEEWALSLSFRGLSPPAVVCLGEASGVGTLLATATLPDQIFLVCRLDHLPLARRTFDLPTPARMVRLVLEPDRFRPAPMGHAIRLGSDNLTAIQALYAAGEGAAGAFAPYQLADGVYYGMEADRELVAVAGTHLVAPSERIGAVGNVFTHPAHRRQGYAAACTTAVCRDLLARGLTVVLNVNTDNVAALDLYRRLGFRDHCTYYEVLGTRKAGTTALEPLE